MSESEKILALEAKVKELEILHGYTRDALGIINATVDRLLAIVTRREAMPAPMPAPNLPVRKFKIVQSEE